MSTDTAGPAPGAWPRTPVVDADYLRRLDLPWYTAPHTAGHTASGTAGGARAAAIDLSAWMPPVIDQGQVPLCTAAVTAALAGYYARRGRREEFTASVLFNYRTSRALRGDVDARGSRLEHSFRAWAEYGLCAEALWPWAPDQLDRVDRDPPRRAYDQARWSRPVARRVTAPDGAALVDVLRHGLARGVPASVEIRLCPSLSMSLVNGGILPVQLDTEVSVGPHVLLLTGYDDHVETEPYARGTGPGAFRVRNSWGLDWGREGYGLLPYGFLVNGLVKEAWIVVERDWEQPT